MFRPYHMLVHTDTPVPTTNHANNDSCGEQLSKASI